MLADWLYLGRRSLDRSAGPVCGRGGGPEGLGRGTLRPGLQDILQPCIRSRSVTWTTCPLPLPLPLVGVAALTGEGEVAPGREPTIRPVLGSIRNLRDGQDDSSDQDDR